MNGYDINDDNYLQKMFIDQVKPCLNGGGGDIPAVIQALTVTENGTYEAPEGVDGYSPVVVEVASTGGGDIDALIDRSITEISSDMTSVGEYAFYKCSKLTTANFPATTSIGESAFHSCSALTEVYFPAATSIGGNAFYYCGNLTTVNFPVATKIGNYAFQYCPLTTVNFPAATSIGGNAFYGCSAMTEVYVPAATSVGSNAFYQCSAMTTVDLPAATSVGSNAFYLCSKLTVVVLRSETMVTLSKTNAFGGTPIASGTGYIYVPSALIEQYKVASNWSTYAAQFRALEDYTVDGTTTGALDESKI